MTPGEHTIEWRYVKDSSKAVGADSGWVDRVEFPTNGLESSRALGEPGLDFRASPADAWNFIFQDEPHAESLPLGDGESATIKTEVVGPCRIRWRWAVECEPRFDYFVCTVDGKEKARISGSKRRDESIHLPAGRHVIAWTYRKDLALPTYGDYVTLSNVRVVSSPLQVHVDGAGKIIDSGGERTHGSNYTVTAEPLEGSTFAAWTSNTGIVSTTPTLTFTMETGLELTAHFAPGPFTLLKGRYLGLFIPAPGADGAAGLLDLQVTPFGAFSGTLTVRGIAVRLQGQFAGDGSFAQTVRVPDGSMSELFLSLDVAGAAPHLSGTLNGVGSGATLAVDRAARDSAASPFLAGPYTALLETDLADTIVPRGIGFATGEMTTSGKLRLAGRLGNGRSFSLATKFAEDGTAPIYLWAGNGGSELAGTISLDDSQLRGTLRWRRPTGAAAGFDTTVALRGSPYAKPAKGAPVFPAWPATEENGWISLGDIVTGQFTLGPDHVPRFLPPNDAHIKLSLSLANGLFTGSFRLEGADEITTFSGALLPSENRAGGFFRQPNGESEAVRIEAAP